MQINTLYNAINARYPVKDILPVIIKSKKYLRIYNMELPVAIGIDLGTTNSCVGWWNKDKGCVDILPNPQGHRTTPSYVAFTDKEKLVGEPAKKQQLKNTQNTIYESKRFIGRTFNDPKLQAELKHTTDLKTGESRSQFPFKLVDIGDDKPQFYVTVRDEPRLFYPEEIAAIILTHMKENAENSIGKQAPRAVITVPAYFNDAQRQATRDAGYIAGLEVLRIINEPTAAAIAYGLDKKPKELEHEINILVFDLGGGTLDTSLLSVTNDGIFEVKAIAGDTRLGGADFDQRLIDHCANAFKQQSGKNVFDNPRSIRKLRSACEQAKCELSDSLSTTIYVDSLMAGEDLYIDVTRAQFESMCSDLFNKCIELTKKTLKDGRVMANQVEDIVLVGGSTRIPKIQDMLSSLFADVHTGTPKKLCKSINPDEAVAYGASIQAAMLNYIPEDAEGVYRSEEEDYDENLPDYVLLDVNPLSLGLETTGGLMNVIIPRNTTIPITKTKIFSTVEDNQTAVTISVFEGERSTVEHNRLLGEFELDGIEPQERGMPQIEVTFAIDADGIFTVRAKDTTPRNDREFDDIDSGFKTLTIKHSNRNPDEVEKLVNNAKQFEEEDAKYRQLVRTKNQFVNLLYATRNLIYKDEKVKGFITESDKKLVEEILKNEMEWIQNIEETTLGTEDKTTKTTIEEKMDYIQNDLIQPIIDKINVARRQTNGGDSRVNDETEN
jgi:heat shock protein 1/8